ncbi:MAG: A/G-specific adenine glycosylase [Acidimicrobiaceae bacterium]|jgi:A/G-specific adenine glycosylase|nr:A/G-specific adenine glycosylase [Acidimicrobiaceae bacterium]
MLQQTQVVRVIPRWEAFLARFPDPASCAAAPVAEVIGLWSGLGYNRRAVHLHRAAAAMVVRHDGQLPSTLAELLALPGLGPYTARAVMAFAFGFPEAVVDTNVARVLARAVAGRRLSAAEAQAAADSLVSAVPASLAWTWNQALLDLGAQHCTSLRPSCAQCPLRAQHCAWATAHFPQPDPATGSAAVSQRQAPFAGSDRQGRGRLVKMLQRGPLPRGEWAGAAGWPGDDGRAARVAASLVADGLAVQAGDQLALP